MKIIDLSGEYTEKMWYYGEPYTPYSVKDLACVDKNGENSGAFAQSRKNQRSLRQAHVLSQIRKQSLYGNSKTYAQGGQRGGYARRTRPR